MLRKILVLSIAALQVSVFGSLLAWRVTELNEAGWAGMAYHIDLEAEVDRPLPGFFTGAASREVKLLLPGGPAEDAGILKGDRVVSVNSVPVADLGALRELAAASSTGDQLQYLLERDGAVREVVVCLEAPFRLPMILATTVSSVVVGAVFILISLLVYWGRPRSQTALVFFLMCAFGGAQLLLTALIELDIPSPRGITPAVIDTELFVGLGLMGMLWVGLVNTLLHLSLIFPRRRPILERWPALLIWLHTLPLLMVAALAVLVGTAVVSKHPPALIVVATLAIGFTTILLIRLRRRASEIGWIDTVKTNPLSVQGAVLAGAMVFGLLLRLMPEGVRPLVVVGVFLAGFATIMLAIVGYSAMTIFNLYRSYRDSGTDEKRQVRWPLWGTLTAVGGVFVVFIVALVLSFVLGEFGRVDYTTNIVLNAVSRLFYLLIPISLAFGIIKYRLMEIDLIIRKTVVYSAVTGFVLVVYLVLAGVSGLALVRSAGLESQAATVMATLVVVLLFVPVRNRAQRVVDRLFFQREQDTEASMARITETVMQADSVGRLTLGVAEEVQRALRCRAVAVFVCRAGSERYTAEATVGLPDTARSGLSLSAGSPILESAGVHVVVGRDELTDEEIDVARRTAAVRAIICRRGDEPVGVVTVGKKLSGEAFDDEDEVFLEAVAGQLTVGFGRLRGRRAELEFAQALHIQRSLLPAEIPQINGVQVVARWQPAREVSGDYYDVLQLDRKRLALCIGDVVGKGMPAALLMSSLQAAVKAVAVGDADSPAVCTQVRSVVTSNLKGGKFVTFFFAVVDAEDGRLTYTNCGHNQPVLVRADGTAVRLSEGGPAMARVLHGLDYARGEAAIASGDRLVLFTDGVSEAANSGGEQFGEERLVELVVAHRSEAAPDLERSVTEAVLEHAEGALQDDLTLVVLAVE